VHRASHAPFVGFNRAQAAVIEAAILVSRLRMLRRDFLYCSLHRALELRRRFSVRKTWRRSDFSSSISARKSSQVGAGCR